VGLPAGYALVGAAAVFSSAARAPLTAVIIMMEMSQNYILVLPLILAVVIATRAADLVLAESIYTLKLVRRGIHIFRDTAIDIFQQVSVRDAMVTEVPVIAPDVSVAAAAKRLVAERHRSFAVVRNGRLQGIVTVPDLERSQQDSDRVFTVGDVMTTDVVVAYPDESLREAMHLMSEASVEQLLVVDPKDPRRLVGLLRRLDVVNILEAKLGRPPDQAGPMATPRSRNGAFVWVYVPATSPHVRQTLREMHLPPGMVMVSVRRGGETLTPDDDTVLMPRDNVLIHVVPRTAEQNVRHFIELGNSDSNDASNI
jgi:chloride channel protein, CIC family